MSSNFERVSKQVSGLQYMKQNQADFMRDFITKNDISNVLEIGFFKGKSSAYIASVLEDLGRGHLVTIDKKTSKKLSPNITEVLDNVDLAHRVTPTFSHRSYTWELGKMIRQSPRPQFDMCYFDGGHTWDMTGFGFFLVDMLLKPGGWIIFDDLNWTINKSLANAPQRARMYADYSEDEKEAQGVRLVFETITNHLGYSSMREVKKFSWGVARKPANNHQRIAEHGFSLFRNPRSKRAGAGAS